MIDIREKIAKGDILLASGAMGTRLIDAGYGFDDCLEELNITNPELIERIIRSDFESGADIIKTNTFQPFPSRLTKMKITASTAEIVRKAVTITRSMAGREAYIAGVCGPLLPEDVSLDEITNTFLETEFSPVIHVLIDAEVDFILLETMAGFIQAETALRIIKKYDPDIPVAVSFAFMKKDGMLSTLDGSAIDEIISQLVASEADIIGSNCGQGVEVMLEIADHFFRQRSKPLMFQPSAGEPRLENGRWMYPDKPEDFSRGAKILMEKGASILGGCCGTNEKYIKSMRTVIDAYHLL